ncbi:MAG: glycosyltransferase [Planctomycetales bacterium]|nr:glycosyltransferase [Planctomycetales bacterium]
MAGMRVALVITELDPGGAETCLVNLALHLKRNNHPVRVFSLGPAPQAGQTKLVDRLQQAGIEWFCGNARGTKDLWRVIRWLRTSLAEFNPDIVQSMLFHANLVVALTGIHRQAQFLGGARVRQPERIRGWLQKWASARMSKLVCVSHAVAENIKICDRIPSDKLVVIPNGVEVTTCGATAQESRTLPTNANTILFVGRLAPQKGVLPFIEQVPRLLEGSSELQLVLVGDGPLANQLADHVQSLGQVRKQISFAGWQPEPIEWMKGAGCLVLPALYEGMPNVVLEASSVAKPIVAFDVEGIREVLPIETQEYQLAAPGDWQDFLAKVRYLMLNSIERNRIGEQNKAHVLANFELHQQLDRYVQLYESVQQIKS